MRFQASSDDNGKRLDAVLTAAAATERPLSRSRVAELIRQGLCKVNGQVERSPAKKLRGTEVLALRIPPPEPAEPEPEAIPLEILFEDETVVVLNKPAGLVVHPAAGHPSGTLVNALLHHCGGSLSGIGGVRRPGIVHRLDKDTSGVMVVAKTDQAHADLAAQFADHGRTNRLDRRYTAFVWGSPKPRLTIDAPIGRDRANRLKMQVRDGPGSRAAITHTQRLDSFGNKDRPVAAKIDCRLETGRTHQIRVHLAHIGHGLIGDQDYGLRDRTRGNRLSEPARSFVQGFGRQALQARSLQFSHPKTQQTVRFEVNPDADMVELEEHLKQA